MFLLPVQIGMGLSITERWRQDLIAGAEIIYRIILDFTVGCAKMPVVLPPYLLDDRAGLGFNSVIRFAKS